MWYLSIVKKKYELLLKENTELQLQIFQLKKLPINIVVNNIEIYNSDDDIYSFVVSPPLYIECNQVISGVTKDIDTQELLPGVLVQLFDEQGNELDSFLSKFNKKNTCC